MRIFKDNALIVTPIIVVLILGVAIFLHYVRASDPYEISTAAPAASTTIIDENLAAGPVDEPIITLLFVGDMMFDRGTARHAKKYGIDSLFKGVEELFKGNDAIIGNLEGTITTQASIAQRDRTVLRFTFDPAFAAALKEEGFAAVSLANNHSTDFYAAGMEETRGFLEAQGIAHFGSAYNDSVLSTVLEIKGKSICLVGYHDLYTFDPAPTNYEIKRLRPECDQVIVMPHWGNEYEQKQSPREIRLAHGFIDAGADLVVGSHPHVVQPMEIYEGKAIFYSLGNFIFDQGLSFWTEHGLALKVVLKEGSEMTFVPIPTALHSTEVSVASEADAEKILEILREKI